MKSINHHSRYVSSLIEILHNIDYSQIENVTTVMDSARKRGNAIFFIGNGGSAATASHFANDLALIRMPSGHRHFHARSLADNIAYLTALSNDEGYEYIFMEQLKGAFRKGDVLVAISASGNSKNVLNAIRYAKRLGGTTVGLIGFDGGKMKNLCDRIIHFDSRIGEYGPVEDMHLIFNHMIAAYFISKSGAKQIHRNRRGAK